MAWNHRSAIVAMAIAIQAVPNVFTAPAAPADLIAVSVPANDFTAITADDPTATGTIWRNRRIYLGKNGTAGATIPLRGPGGVAPPAANAWVPGRVFQAAGHAEIRNAAPIAGVFQAGSTVNSVILAAAASAVDDLYLGAPLQTANVGAGFRQTTLISDYDGATKTATIPETIVAPAAGDAYTIPAYLSYVLGTLTTPPPLLSISIWRDKKRYDYRDWRPTAFSVDVPVANDQNTVFPSADFSGRGVPVAVVDDVAPALPDAMMAISPAPARGGKFVFDRIKLGHQDIRFALAIDVAAASNQNQDAGQDQFDITGGTRTISLDLNQMNVTDLNLATRIDNQTIMPILSTWGLGSGNNFGLVLPGNVIDPLNPGDRNGFVNLTGNAYPAGIDKSAAFTIWW
jgi:hypothetical protein